jgi:aminoglycoside phosphotransferase (APT) family kinase protein
MQSDDELASRLRAFLRDETGDQELEVSEVTPLTGGYSLFTARFTVTSAAGSTTYVLRADPPADASLTSTDRVKEWDLLAALTAEGSMPMPAARYADVDGTRLGSRAIILDHVDGPQLLGRLQEADDAEQAALALQLATTIGVVHRAGAGAAPPSFDRPSSWDAYIDEFIAGWRQVEAANAEHNPFIRWVAAWLDVHRPPAAPLTLVHGEFQTGNVMLDPSGEMSVIDWEYAHVGDPRVDLGWIQNVANFSPPDLIAIDPDGFCTRYREVTGLSEDVVNPGTVAWFSILGGYKAIGALMQGMNAMAAGANHLITSAYLVSALPLSHRIWREAATGLEAAMAATELQMEAAS